MKLAIVASTLFGMHQCLVASETSFDHRALYQRSAGSLSSSYNFAIVKRGNGSSPSKQRPQSAAGSSKLGPLSPKKSTGTSRLGPLSPGHSSNKSPGPSPSSPGQDKPFRSGGHPMVPPLKFPKHFPAFQSPPNRDREHTGLTADSSLGRTSSGLSWTSSSSAGRSPEKFEKMRIGGDPKRSAWVTPVADMSAKPGIITKHDGSVSHKSPTNAGPSSGRSGRSNSPYRIIDPMIPDTYMFTKQQQPEHEKID